MCYSHQSCPSCWSPESWRVCDLCLGCLSRCVLELYYLLLAPKCSRGFSLMYQTIFHNGYHYLVFLLISNAVNPRLTLPETLSHLPCAPGSRGRQKSKVGSGSHPTLYTPYKIVPPWAWATPVTMTREYSCGWVTS